MAGPTDIEWCDRVWNPVAGCTPVSEGCRKCYAATFAHRGLTPLHHGLTVLSPDGPRFNGTIRLNEAALLAPLKWRKPVRIFVNSMSDLFHDGVPDEFIDRVMAVVALCPQHTFIVLTKRPKRMREYTTHRTSADGSGCISVEAIRLATMRPEKPNAIEAIYREPSYPLPNLWLGVSAENQATLDERLPELLATPAAVRLLSLEPLLGPIDLMTAKRPERFHRQPDGWRNWLPRYLHWVIVGGESGPRARPMSADWVLSIRDQCRNARVPFFLKQWGEWWPVQQWECEPDRWLPDESEWSRHPRMRRLAVEDGGDLFYRFGKNRAGCLLDGREHKEFPR